MSRVVDLPVRPHATFPRLLKPSLILCWHSEAGKPSFKYEHMMEAQDFCTVCVCQHFSYGAIKLLCYVEVNVLSSEE